MTTFIKGLLAAWGAWRMGCCSGCGCITMFALLAAIYWFATYG